MLLCLPPSSEFPSALVETRLAKRRTKAERYEATGFYFFMFRSIHSSTLGDKRERKLPADRRAG